MINQARSDATIGGGTLRTTPRNGDPPGTARSGLPYRVTLTLVLAALLGFALGVDDRLRGWEAYLASHVVALGARTKSDYSLTRAVVSYDEGTANAGGLMITPECTSAFLVVPLIIVTALLVWLRRKVTLWPMLALLAAILLLATTNQVRILTCVLLIKGFGFDPGYYWGHTMVGSVISVIGIGTALVAYVLLAIRRNDARTAERQAVNAP
ncbi:hypothetical protein [Sinosporangium siamense]|uniref:Exosortase/archaeosortase family protein n=1 Tax=Sinosporangium siamense TaxID=1367973 RepID=A0A919RN69_9ACTN|nr:hypothetical protein [Sinosporangium siamense]GII96267.1 hypothetical protein Ssi02_64980 [Sinosporangium siamense]